MTEQLQPQNPFGESGEVALTESGVVASHAREEYELKAMFAVAHQMGRNERDAYDRIMASCERPGFADGTTYAFPRGGRTIDGPSVKLARECARCWGGIVYDLRVVETSNDEVHIRAVAIDLVNVTRVAMEDKFKRMVQRKDKQGNTQWVEPDERDTRELVNRRGAICVRNALLQLLPPDIVDDALGRAKWTLQQKAQGDLSENRTEVIKALVGTFKGLGVTRPMLEQWFGRPLEQLTETKVTELRSIYQSITDSYTGIWDHFEGVDRPEQSAEAQDLDKQVAKKGAGSPQEPAAASGAQDESKAPQEPQGDEKGESSDETTSAQGLDGTAQARALKKDELVDGITYLEEQHGRSAAQRQEVRQEYLPDYEDVDGKLMGCKVDGLRALYAHLTDTLSEQEQLI